MSKAKTPYEQRIALQNQIDQIDLTTLKAVLAALQSPEAVAFRAQLEALFDPNDATAMQRSSGADANALLANLLVPFQQGPDIAQGLIDQLSERLEPAPVAPEAPAE